MFPFCVRSGSSGKLRQTTDWKNKVLAQFFFSETESLLALGQNVLFEVSHRGTFKDCEKNFTALKFDFENDSICICLKYLTSG